MTFTANSFKRGSSVKLQCVGRQYFLLAKVVSQKDALLTVRSFSGSKSAAVNMELERSFDVPNVYVDEIGTQFEITSWGEIQ